MDIFVAHVVFGTLQNANAAGSVVSKMDYHLRGINTVYLLGE